VLERRALDERREQMRGLLEIAQSECRSLYEQTADYGCAVLFTDAEAVILDYVCDPNLETLLNRKGLMRGALWSEYSQGTNGMGTCIASGKLVTVYRDDHFHDAHVGLTCLSVPVRDPFGELLGVLDMTSCNTRDSRQAYVHAMALMKMTAGFIEHRNFQRHFRDATLLRFHSRPELLGIVNEGMLALGEDGRIVAVNENALTQLCYADREQLVGRNLEEVFAITPEVLAERAASQPYNIWPVFDAQYGRRYLALMRRPESHVRARPGMARSRGSVVVRPATKGLCLDLNSLEGGDAQMSYNARCARRLVNKDVYMLLSGETGAGKEVFARAVHCASERADRPFVALNCAAIPESLIESELFGYRSGAFTGARREGMRGSIQQSSGGTLFLNEIGDMPLTLQSRLLRVLESKEVLPLGSQEPVAVDLHVISATNRDLHELVARGEFREDLYYRLNGITLELPPLRARADLEALLRCALASENDTDVPISVDGEAFRQLLRYPWPGNIRELRNVIRSALALCDDHTIRLADLPKAIASYPPDGAAPCPAVAPSAADSGCEEVVGQAVVPVPCSPLERAEREALIKELEANRWNVTITAERLGMSRSTLYRRLKKYGIPVTQLHDT